MDVDRPPDIIVIAGGDAVPELSAPTGALVVAADAGVAHAWAVGLDVDVAVGDFDSLAGDDVALLDDRVADVRRHPVAKDATDLHLALLVCADRAPARVLVAGVEGGRPDHALANLLVASSPEFSSLDIEVLLARSRAWVVHDDLHGSVPPGLVSVLPLHGDAVVSLAGCRWPLDRERLGPGTTRGISNETDGQPFRLTVHHGTVLCFAPDPEE